MNIQKLTFDQKWEVMFLDLLSHYQKTGTLHVRIKENRKLNSWVATQRSRHKAGELPTYRKEKLDSLGFEWDPLIADWETNFSTLVEFKHKFGHTNVPQRSAEHSRLGKWVHDQRVYKRQGTLLNSRFKALLDLGFQFEITGSEIQYMSEPERHRKALMDLMT